MSDVSQTADPVAPMAPEGSLQITVNGNASECAAGLNIEQLIEYLGLPPQRVAVERNRVIVRRDQRHATFVHNGDVFEIVTFVGGG